MLRHSELWLPMESRISKWEWVGFVVISTYYFSPLYLRFYSTLTFNEIMNRLTKLRQTKSYGLHSAKKMRKRDRWAGTLKTTRRGTTYIHGDGILRNSS